MSIQIRKLDRDCLIRIEPLLSESAGYQTSMSDELDFFNSTFPKGWFVAFDEKEEPVGFVRSFEYGDWSHGEIFVRPSAFRSHIANQLLKVFTDSNQFPSGHRLRFDIAGADAELKSCIEHHGLNQKAQTFFYFELNIGANYPKREVNYEYVSPSEVAEVLSHLSPVSISEVESWIKSGSIRTITSGGKLAAAAQVFVHNGTAELNRIAAHASFLRQGFSKQLMQRLIEELSCVGVRKLFLRVEDVRKPAICFYESLNFKKIENQTQIWYSKMF